MPWWGTPKKISERLRTEVEMMGVAFGETFQLQAPSGRQLYWLGAVEINMKGVSPREHILKILYPDDYPNRAAEAYVVRPKTYSEKHQFEDGQLCLFNPKDGTDYGWNPAGSTAVTVTAWAIEWLYAYYTWRALNRWPGTEEWVRKE